MSDSLLVEPSRSINNWCKHRGISRAKFYQLDKVGLAPKTHNIGKKRLIGPLSDAEWIREREREAESRIAKRVPIREHSTA
jgi:predicted DNA-binding transcriptional regulator AlpA